VRGIVGGGDPRTGDWTLTTEINVGDGRVLQHRVSVRGGYSHAPSTAINGTATGPAPSDVSVSSDQITFTFNAEEPVKLATAPSLMFSASLVHDGVTSECEKPS
jgi:hypothetical protein